MNGNDSLRHSRVNSLVFFVSPPSIDFLSGMVCVNIVGGNGMTTELSSPVIISCCYKQTNKQESRVDYWRAFVFEVQSPHPPRYLSQITWPSSTIHTSVYYRWFYNERHRGDNVASSFSIQPISMLTTLALLSEPYCAGNSRAPSTLFCCLYKFFTMRLSERQVSRIISVKHSLTDR